MESLPIERAVVIKEENFKLMDVARAFTIKDQPTYEAAVEQVKKVKDRRKWWANLIRPVKEASRSAWQRIVDLEKEIDAPLSVIENEILKPKLVGWEIIQEQERLKKQERLSSELKKQDEENRLSMAMELEKCGNKAGADSVMDAPLIAPAVEIPRKTNVAGTAYRDHFSAIVIDMKAFVDAVAAGKIPLDAVIPNAVFLGTQARSFKGLLSWPGVEIRKERIVAIGGRRF